jgi:hypothetical protein
MKSIPYFFDDFIDLSQPSLFFCLQSVFFSKSMPSFFSRNLSASKSGTLPKRLCRKIHILVAASFSLRFSDMWFQYVTQPKGWGYPLFLNGDTVSKERMGEHRSPGISK